MLKRIALILAAAICFVSLSAKAASLTMADFAHSIKLMVAGYTGSEMLTNFPVLVRISESSIDGFLYSDMKYPNDSNKTDSSYYRDLAFFNAAGGKLKYEIDSWSKGGESLVWVKLPAMENGTTFTMCWGASTYEEVTAADRPWGDYAGVWHLRETGKDKQIFDSSTNALHGYTAAGEGNSSSKIGAGRRIAKDRNHAYGIVVDATNGVPQKAVADSLGTDFTASFWMNPQGSKVADFNYGFLIDRRKGEYNDPGGWGIRLHDGNSGKQQLQVYAADELIPGLPANDKYNGTMTASQYAGLYTIGTWTKVDIRWYAKSETAGAADIYVNGAFVETVALPKPPKQDGTTNIGIGGSTQDDPTNSSPTAQQKGRRFNGFMDEVRLRPGAVSADWIKADFDTVNNTSFITLAPPETLAIAWLNASGAEPGLDEIGHNFAIFEGTVWTLGDVGLSSCSIQCKVWKTSESEPENWTTLTNGLVALDAFEVSVTGLELSTEYNYKLRAIGNDQAEENATEPVSGTFTTGAGLTITWTAASGTTGFSGISYDVATVGGTVSALGGATMCLVQGKIWERKSLLHGPPTRRDLR